MGVLISWIALGALLLWDYHKKKKADRYADWIMQLRNGKKGD